MSFAATWIDRKIITLIRHRKLDTDRKILYAITHMWNLIFKKV